MNKERRAEIAKATKLMAEAKSILDDVLSEEQDAYDNMPEGLQQGERGDAAQEAIQALEEATNNLDDGISALEAL